MGLIALTHLPLNLSETNSISLQRETFIGNYGTYQVKAHDHTPFPYWLDKRPQAAIIIKG